MNRRKKKIIVLNRNNLTKENFEKYIKPERTIMKRSNLKKDISRNDNFEKGQLRKGTI